MQTNADGKLHADFEESGSSFDYSTSVRRRNWPSCGEDEKLSFDLYLVWLHP